MLNIFVESDYVDVITIVKMITKTAIGMIAIKVAILIGVHYVQVFMLCKYEFGSFM